MRSVVDANNDAEYFAFATLFTDLVGLNMRKYITASTVTLTESFVSTFKNKKHYIYIYSIQVKFLGLVFENLSFLNKKYKMNLNIWFTCALSQVYGFNKC